MNNITQPLIAIAVFLFSAQIFSQGTLQVTGNATVITNGDVTPSTVDDTDFGNVTIGFNNPNTFVIDNTAGGGGPGNRVNNITVTITGVNAAEFTPNIANLGNLKGNDTPLNHIITFTPTGAGLRTANVTITFTNGTNSPYSFSIQGTGLTPAPEIDITGLGVSIADGDTTPSSTDDTDYGATDIGVPVAKTYTIRNTGTLTLNVGAITFSGANPTEFVVTTPPAATVAAGANTTFVVTFTPLAAGIRTATLSLVNDDLDENPYNFDLLGDALYPPPTYTAIYETFDASNGGWTPVVSTNDTWTWTTTYPISVTDEIAEGGFWRSGNFNNYLDNTNIVVESPVYDFTGLQNLQLSIDVEYDTQNNTDGMRILYSVSGGAYTVLGASGSGTNWYDDNVSALGSDGWNDDSHPNSPSFPGRFSHFKNAIITLSDGTFRNQSNVRFRIEFSSDGSTTDDGVGFDNFRIEADPITALGDAAIAPANLTSNLRLWLKTNSGVSVSDGAAFTTWEDQAYNTSLDKEDAHAVASIAPTFRDNATRNINYNPVADFNNSNTEYMNGKGGYYSQDYFVVVKSDDVVDTQTGTFSPGRQFAIGGRSDKANYHEDPTGLAFGSSTARYLNEIVAHNMGAYSQSGSPGVNSYGRAYTSATDSYNHVLILNVKANSAATAKEIYKNGKRIDNATGTTGTSGTGTPLNYYEFNNLPFIVGAGRSGLTGRTTSQLNGMLSEIVSYDTPNSALNQQKIQSYLGLKYGVTLQDAATSLTNYRVNDVDYIDSNGAVFWDTSLHAGYNYDIAGIGRDDGSQLLQKQSVSQNIESDATGPTSGFLSMALTQTYATNNANIANNTTTFNDREFLMWGNNNASLDGSATNITVDMSTDLGDATLTTFVSFTAIPRIWKVVEIAGDVPSVEVSIPTSIVRTAAPPDGRYLMFISSTGVFDPTADYRVMTETGSNLFTDYDFDGTEYITFGWAPETVFERSVNFDPTNTDYIDIEDNLDPNPSGFTLSCWIKRDTNSGGKAILSKRDAAYTEGFDFKLTNGGNFQVRWRDSGGSSQSLISSVVIPQNEWHHLAVTYNGTTGTLYIDGIADTSSNLNPPVPNNQSFFIGAAGKNAPQAFFDGNIDEVRVWESALTATQLRYIMNQELSDNASFVSGEYFQNRSISPTKDDVSTIPWTDLAGYYPMSTYTYTNTKDESGNGRQGSLKNLKTVDRQTAPLPYETTQGGDWDDPNTWLNGDVQTIPGTASIVDNTKSVDWNIVRTTHDIIINDDSDLPSENNSNRNVLALFVDSNEITLDGDNTAGTGFGLTVTHYLNLDGSIDLNGESQLIQTTGSDLEVASSGLLEKDQQGTADLYTYNYLSSPVGVSNITSNNNSYTLPNVMRNGTLPASPNNITFLSSGYDGSVSGTNISIADYWIWKFANQPDDDYSAWQHIRSTGTLLAGEGYTMKGPGSGGISDDQNYAFLGKPNNADITLNITAGNDYLVGNPYASALDAEQFILDNGSQIAGAGATTGTLYFWEHWGGGSHNLSDYLGGYGTYNLSGGTPSAVIGTNDPDVGTGGTPLKTPGRYIPVSQGFFVVGESTGTINFNNGQRVFQKEGANSVFMEANPTGNETFVPGRSVSNPNDNVADTRMKIRLGYNSVNTLRRQLLLTIDENASINKDWGYDGKLYETQMDDIYWMIEGEKHTIQGTNEILTETVLPLGVHTDSDGMNVITIDSMNNVPANFEIYVHDKELDIYHDLRASDYEFYMLGGQDLERLSIVFNPEALGIDENELTALDIHFSNEIESIVLINPTYKTIKSIDMLNILGQSIYSVNVATNSEYAEYKVNNLSSGTYILQIKTDNGDTLSKKVLVEKM